MFGLKLIADLEGPSFLAVFLDFPFFLERSHGRGKRRLGFPVWRVWLVKSTQVVFKRLQFRIYLFALVEPLGDFNSRGAKTFVHQNYGPVVANVSNYSPNRLIYRSLCLKLVPSLAVQQTVATTMTLVKIFFFYENFRVVDLGKRNSSYYHTSCSVICEVNSLGQLSSANSEKCCLALTVHSR